jgi:hypothetical protein
MHSIASLFHWHPYISTAVATVAANWIVNGLVSTMPPLPANAGFWGTWAYRLFQFLGANWDKIAASFAKIETKA